MNTNLLHHFRNLKVWMLTVTRENVIPCVLFMIKYLHVERLVPTPHVDAALGDVSGVCLAFLLLISNASK